MQRIDQRLAELGRSEYALLTESGFGRDLIRDIRRKSGSPTVETIEKVARALDCAPHWLAFGGDAAMVAGAGGFVPVLGQVAAGAWHEVDDGLDEPRSNRLLAADPRFPASAQYGVTAVGESMNLLFRDQDDLLCLDFRRLPRPRAPLHDDVVIVEQLRNGGTMRELSAKQLRFTPNGPLLAARSDHPKWRDFTLTPSAMGADNDNTHVEIKAIVLRSERQWWQG